LPIVAVSSFLWAPSESCLLGLSLDKTFRYCATISTGFVVRADASVMIENIERLHRNGHRPLEANSVTMLVGQMGCNHRFHDCFAASQC